MAQPQQKGETVYVIFILAEGQPFLALTLAQTHQKGETVSFFSILAQGQPFLGPDPGPAPPKGQNRLRFSYFSRWPARAGQGRFVDANALPTMKITATPRRIEQLKGPYCGRGLNKFKRGVNVTVAIFQLQKARSYDALIEIYFTAKLQPRGAPVQSCSIKYSARARATGRIRPPAYIL